MYNEILEVKSEPSLKDYLKSKEKVADFLNAFLIKGEQYYNFKDINYYNTNMIVSIDEKKVEFNRESMFLIEKDDFKF